MAYKNKDKERLIKKKHYLKNKERQIKRQLERRGELKRWFSEYKKSLNCSDCGMSFSEHPECCDFHHLDPTTKEGNMLKMILSSKEKLKMELEKCVPLCANCHRIRHRDIYGHL